MLAAKTAKVEIEFAPAHPDTDKRVAVDGGCECSFACVEHGKRGHKRRTDVFLAAEMLGAGHSILASPSGSLVVWDADSPDAKKWCRKYLLPLGAVERKTTRGAHFYLRVTQPARVIAPRPDIDIRKSGKGWVRTMATAPAELFELTAAVGAMSVVEMSRLPRTTVRALRVSKSAGKSATKSAARRAGKTKWHRPDESLPGGGRGASTSAINAALNAVNPAQYKSGSEAWAACVYRAWTMMPAGVTARQVLATIHAANPEAARGTMAKHDEKWLLEDISRLVAKASDMKSEGSWGCKTGEWQPVPDLVEIWSHAKMPLAARRVLAAIHAICDKSGKAPAAGETTVDVHLGVAELAQIMGATKAAPKRGLDLLSAAGIIRQEAEHVWEGRGNKANRVRLYSVSFDPKTSLAATAATTPVTETAATPVTTPAPVAQYTRLALPVEAIAAAMATDAEFEMDAAAADSDASIEAYFGFTGAWPAPAAAVPAPVAVPVPATKTATVPATAPAPKPKPAPAPVRTIDARHGLLTNGGESTLELDAAARRGPRREYRSGTAWARAIKEM